MARSLLVSLLLLAASVPLSSSSATDIWVSPSGSDTTGDGTAARPFGTLPRAQKAVRSIIAADSGLLQTTNITVNVGPGVYYLPSGLHFMAADSGSRAHNTRVSWRGPGPEAGFSPSAAAVVHGGVPIPGKSWKRLSAKSSIFVANATAVAPDQGQPSSSNNNHSHISKSPWRFFNLVESRVGAVLARTPDSGSGYLADVGCSNSASLVQCPPGVLPGDLTTADTSIFANVGANWFSQTLSVVPGGVSVDGTTGAVNVSFHQGTQFNANDKIYIQGDHRLISEPGEWALDSEAGLLYYWPRDQERMVRGDAEIVALSTVRVLDFRGLGWDDGQRAESIDVSGLVLSGSDFAQNYTLFTRTNDTPLQFREGMVRFENSSDCTLTDSALLDAGHSAVWLQGFAQNITVSGNWIERAGFCGAYLQGIYPGDTWSESTAVNGTAGHPGPIRSAAESDVNRGHLFANNFIFDYGRRVGHGSGLWLFQAGQTRIAHNLVQEGPRDAFGIYGVRFGVMPRTLYGQEIDFWTALDNLHTRAIEIDHNEVTNVIRDTSDAGALEYWGSGVNNTAHHNCFSDMDPGIPEGAWMNFLFQDDASHYTNFSSNLLFEVKGAGAQEAGMIKSVGSVFENSIVADSKLGHLFNLCPFIEPAANMVFARNIFANITTNGDPCTACQSQANVCKAKCAKGDKACKAACDQICTRSACNATATATPARFAKWLDASVNQFTGATLHNSSSLAGHSTFGFAKGAPPGWPALSVDDPVMKTWDFNLYWGVQNYTGPAEPTTGGGSVSKEWDKHALRDVDPMLLRRPFSRAWNRTCSDYSLAPSSPAVSKGGFRPFDPAVVGLTATGFRWQRSLMGAHDASVKIQAERYARMSGLWRRGSCCLAGGDHTHGFVWSDAAWARFDNVNVDCPGPSCEWTIRFRSSPTTASNGSRSLALAVDAPLQENVVARLQVPETAGQEWKMVSASVPGGLVRTGAMLFLLLDGECEVDYFFLRARTTEPASMRAA